jgi:hypothetical protein
MYRYAIDSLNSIEIFKEGAEAPMLRQPHYPNKDAFETMAEAEDWAKLFILSITDEEAPFAPSGKGLAGRPKPTKEQKLEMLKKEAERFGDNVPEHLANKIAELEAEPA